MAEDTTRPPFRDRAKAALKPALAFGGIWALFPLFAAGNAARSDRATYLFGVLFVFGVMGGMSFLSLVFGRPLSDEKNFFFGSEFKTGRVVMLGVAGFAVMFLLLLLFT